MEALVEILADAESKNKRTIKYVGNWMDSERSP